MKKVSVILPCRNEERGISICLQKIKRVFREKMINGEIVVSSNSSDGSDNIAKRLKAKVIKHRKIGYGNAYITGLRYAKGDYIVIGDADNTYDFLEMPKLIKALDEGYDLVLGSRIKGIKPNSMKWLHRHIGNPLLTAIFNMLFGTRLSDTHTGFRAVTKAALKKMKLKAEGMEFALEMLIKAKRNNLKIKEIPITYYPRLGDASKLNSFKDGFAHLRFMISEWRAK